MSDATFIRKGFAQAQASLAKARGDGPETYTINGIVRYGTVSSLEDKAPISQNSTREELGTSIVSTREQFTETNKPKHKQIVEVQGKRLIVDVVYTSPTHYKILCIQSNTRG